MCFKLTKTNVIYCVLQIRICHMNGVEEITCFAVDISMFIRCYKWFILMTMREINSICHFIINKNSSNRLTRPMHCIQMNLMRVCVISDNYWPCIIREIVSLHVVKNIMAQWEMANSHLMISLIARFTTSCNQAHVIFLKKLCVA